MANFGFPSIVDSTIEPNATEHNLSWKDISRTGIQGISNPLCYPKDHYRVEINPPLDLESQETSAHRHTLYLSDPF
jgi:hypothetical protein